VVGLAANLTGEAFSLRKPFATARSGTAGHGRCDREELMRHEKSSPARFSQRGALPPGAFGRLSSRFEVPLPELRDLLFLPVEEAACEAFRLEGRHAAFLKNGSAAKSSKYPDEV